MLSASSEFTVKYWRRIAQGEHRKRQQRDPVRERERERERKRERKEGRGGDRGKEKETVECNTRDMSATEAHHFVILNSFYS